jgi:hypothetical protein
VKDNDIIAYGDSQEKDDSERSDNVPYCLNRRLPARTRSGHGQAFLDIYLRLCVLPHAFGIRFVTYSMRFVANSNEFKMSVPRFQDQAEDISIQFPVLCQQRQDMISTKVARKLVSDWR